MAGSMELYDCGYLEIIKGPMFSGKTTRLLDIYKKYNFCDIKTMVINYAKDNRYSNVLLSSHDKVMIPCIKALKLSDIIQFTNDTLDYSINKKYYEEFLLAKVILINEGQFFADIVEWVKIAVEKYHKNVYICGLNSDFQRNKFGNWLDLEIISDNVVMLHSFCSSCKRRPAIFSHRLSKEAELEIIGADCYIPVCRKCYNTLIEKNKEIEKIEEIITENDINKDYNNEDVVIDSFGNQYIFSSKNIHFYPLKKVNN
jgi:thymidine kinase